MKIRINKIDFEFIDAEEVDDEPEGDVIQQVARLLAGKYLDEKKEERRSA